MKMYLFLNQPDPIQNSLGSRIESLTGGKLQVGTLSERKAHVLLAQTFLSEPLPGSCLVTVNRGSVRAAAGGHLAWRLIWLLGPLQAWRVWALAQPRNATRR